MNSIKAWLRTSLGGRIQGLCFVICLGCSVLLYGCQSSQTGERSSSADEQGESTDPDRPSPPVPMAATLLGDFANLELTISADRAGLIQKAEISKPSQAKVFDEQTRAWVEKHWKMPPAQAAEPDSRKFIAPIVYPKGHTPAGGKYPAPQYPYNLMRDRVQGLVVLEIEVAESGLIESATVLLSTGSKALGEHTRDWVLKHWVFPPGRRAVIWRCEYQMRQ